MPRSSEGGILPAVSLAALFAWLSICALYVFWRTLHLPFALDDLDQLQSLALMRSGQVSVGAWLMLPHNEHLVPWVRLLFCVATWLSGLDAAAARILVLLIHSAGALACAMLTMRFTRSRFAAWVAGTLYVGAAGFSGSAIWEITIACFSIAATLLAFAFVVITGPEGHRRGALIASLILILASCGGMVGAVIATVSAPVYVYIGRPKLAGGRLRAVLAYTILQTTILLGYFWLLAHWVSLTRGSILSGLLGGGWLTLTAPYRFLMAWVPVADSTLVQSIQMAAMWSVIAWALLIFSLRWLDKAAVKLLLALWMGTGLFALAVGAGRSDTPFLTLFLTDRYYYFFLLPLCIHAAALVSKVRMQRTGAYAVAALLVAGLTGSRMKLNLAIPWAIYGLHEKAISQGKALVDLVAARVSTPDHSRELSLADGKIPFDGIHKGSVAFSTLFFTEFPGGLQGVRWTRKGANIPSVDASFENQLLDGWSQGMGSISPVCVVNGRLQEVRAVSWIDFREGSFENAVIGGFHAWEQTFRWMSRSGTVRLSPDRDNLVIRAHVPLALLRKKWPDLQGLRAHVQIDSKPAAELLITRADEQEFHVLLPAEVRSHTTAGQSIDVTIQSDLTWRGVEVGLHDERELSLALIAIGFPGSADLLRQRVNCGNLEEQR